MWAYQLTAPGHIRRVNVASPDSPLPPDHLRIRIRAVGICGSDMPKFLGTTHSDFPGPFGFPAHEIVGEVVESTDADYWPQQRVVGFASESTGLRELITNPSDLVCPLPPALTDVEAVLAQPLATVINALGRLPHLRKRRVAVLGLGPLGLMFTQLLKARGAGVVTGVDPVDRSRVARNFGIDKLVTGPSHAWTETLTDSCRPDICVEAVGHQAATIADAIRAASESGDIVAFGVPDQATYHFPFEEFFRKNLTLHAGTTQHWKPVLTTAIDWLIQYRRELAKLVTHVLPVSQAQEAFEFSRHPDASRLKVVMTATSQTSGPERCNGESQPGSDRLYSPPNR